MARKRVLVCPMDWGLGHATRCIPVIRALLAQQCEVMIASSGDALQLIRIEFPFLRSFVLTGYAPEYSTGNFLWSMFYQLPKFKKTIRQEHAEVDHIAKENAVDIIISDNRYGCWSPHVRSVIMTHQVNIQVPFFRNLVRSFNRSALQKFSAVWIPDFEGPSSLSGTLSSPHKLAVTYVGPLSRFRRHDGSVKADNMRYDVVAVLSGPEPQRSILESIVNPQLRNSGLKTLLIKGKPSLTHAQWMPGATETSHLTSEVLNEIMENAGLILCRPGYSTIMDLSVIGGKAIFIPTPGQTEQAYLADRMMKKKVALSVRQEKFNLTECIRQSNEFKGFVPMPAHHLLADAIASLLS